MKYCPNPDCSHAEVVGSPAEYRDEVQVCADCGTPLKWGEPPKQTGEVKKPGIPLVMVDRFNDLMLAQMIRSKLESEGITVYLKNEHGPPISVFPGGGAEIDLMVPEPEVRRAREIIRGTLDTDPIMSAEFMENNRRISCPVERCPRCGSDDIAVFRGSATVKALALLAMVFIIPYLFLKKRTRCRKCGHVWKYDKNEDAGFDDTDAYERTD